MPDLFEVRSSTGSHPVRIADGALRDIVAACEPTIIIADEIFRADLAGGDVPTIFVVAVEETKEFATVPRIIEDCRKAGLTRNGAILAIGGGIIQDLTCFVASVYMRGVRWTYVPTTLLGMVDSCIGGKSSINLGDFKNLVGTFYPPDAVIIPPSVLATLPLEHIAAGRAEAAKICYAHGPATFAAYLAADRGGDVSAALIELSLRSKKWFVEIDEFDRAERLLLNFGHSFGHALESCSGYQIPHGVGVGVGCLAAIETSISMRPTLSEHPIVLAMRDQLLSILATLDGLPAAVDEVRRDDFFRFFNSDKKHSATSYRPILVDADGRLYRDSIPRDADSEDMIWTGFKAAAARLTRSGDRGARDRGLPAIAAGR